MHVTEAAAGVTDPAVGPQGFRQLAPTALHAGEVDADDVIWVREDVQSAVTVSHGGRHGIGAQPPMQLSLDPTIPGVGPEHDEFRPVGEPAGEGDHLELRRVTGIKCQYEELAPLIRLGELGPPLGDRIDDVEDGADGDVAEYQAVAAVDDGAISMEGEETEVVSSQAVGLVERRREGVPGLVVGVAVEDGGREQGEFCSEVAVGDQTMPCFAHGLESE